MSLYSLIREKSMSEGGVSGANAEPSSSKQAAPGLFGSSVIPIMNKVQDICALLPSSSKIHLPQVAVVGSQSSGKSSVLEALVGRDFLPRGSDICTRRPLVVELVHFPRRSDAPAGKMEEWGEFLHFPGKRFYDFSEIRSEIQAQTDWVAGCYKGISDKQIFLKIFSPNVLDITLVDLPGITKVPVGDQPSNIEAIIRKMILSYIKHKTCIILAVSPANVDISNSDALQMARIADPYGSRTIGVITKLDIMDRVVDAHNFLLKNATPLWLGYVGVVNRSQQDINLNRSIKDALANEEAFFRHQPVYHGLSHCCGVPKLAKKLNQILVQHIRSVLPGLKSRINSKLEVVTKEHAAYGNVVESEDNQVMKLLNILTKYCEAFTSIIEEKNEELLIGELSGGAQIHYIFQSIFLKSLEKVDHCEDVSDEDIRMAIQNAADREGALLVPEVPFEVLIRRQIGRLLRPSLQCAKFIYDELIKMSYRCLANELHRYPFLRQCMNEVIVNFLREGLERSKTMISHLIETEMDYINISHPNFIGKNKAVEIAQQQVKASRLAASISRPKLIQKLSRIKTISNKAVEIAQQVKASRLATSVSRPKSATVPSHNVEHSLSMIQPPEPPVILKLSENQSEQEALEISITKLLLESYYDIVKKQIEDIVPKTIMHFMVNHTKRELHVVLMGKLYTKNNFDDMFREPDDIVAKRKMSGEILRLLVQSYKTFEELSLETDIVKMGYSLYSDSEQLSSLYPGSDANGFVSFLEQQKSLFYSWI